MRREKEREKRKVERKERKRKVGEKIAGELSKRNKKHTGDRQQNIDISSTETPAG